LSIDCTISGEHDIAAKSRSVIYLGRRSRVVRERVPSHIVKYDNKEVWGEGVTLLNTSTQIDKLSKVVWSKLGFRLCIEAQYM
jgi:hypothetical protein